MSERKRNVVSITTKPKGEPEEFVWFDCPEEGCSWTSGDWAVVYEAEPRDNYDRHWRAVHAPTPPEPLTGRWMG